MKYYLWVVIGSISLLCALPAIAQQPGIIGGVNMSTITGRVYANPKYGVLLGGYLQYPLTGSFLFEPELLFSMEGGNCSNYNVGPVPGVMSFPTTSSLRLDYVEVPLLLKLRTFKSSFLSNGFDFFAGPDVAFLATTRSEYTSSLPTGTRTVTSNSSDGLRRFDFSVEVGGGPNIALGGTTVGIELRYSLGFTRVFQAADRNWFNNVWSLMAHVSI